MSDELTVGHIEELTREHGPTRLTLPSVNGYVIVGDVLKELRKAKEQIAHHARALAERDEEIARLRAAAREVWDSIPATYDSGDPMVRRHASALNTLNAILSDEVPHE